jgi:hypothetical protein
MSNTIYNYHQQTGEVISAAQADVSPLEPDVVLVPAFATLTKPPVTAIHEVAVYLDADGNAPANEGYGQWQVRSDWRGVPLFSTADGSVVNIEEIGISPADILATDQAMPSSSHTWTGSEWVIDPSKTSIQMHKAKDEKWQLIESERDRRTKAGGYPVGALWFHSDGFSLTQQQGMVLAAMMVQAAGGDLSAPLLADPWRTLTKPGLPEVRVPMTGTLALQLLPAAMEQQAAIYAAADAHKAALELSADPANYDFSTGWPADYTEA